MEAQVERGVGAVQGRSVGDAARSSILQRVAIWPFVLLTLLTFPAFATSYVYYANGRVIKPMSRKASDASTHFTLLGFC
jgi:hypothetical protein